MAFKGRLSALRHPFYRRYWTGSFASVGATQLQIMAQGWLLWELTESAIFLGYLGAAASLPAIIMTLFGGVLADRLDKRKLMMTTSAAVALLLATLAVLDQGGSVAPWHIILIAGLVSFTAGFDWPTRQSIFPTLIDREDMMSAVALNSIIWQSTRMIMPAIGGLLIALVDTWLVFTLCSLGFVVMFFVVMSLKIRKTENTNDEGNTLMQMKAGISFILSDQLFMVYFTLTYTSMFLGMAHLQLMPAFASLLAAAETGYGLLISAGGIGSVIGTLIVGGFQESRRLGWIILGTASGSAVMVLMFTLVTHNADLAGAYVFALGFLLLGSFLSSMFGIASMTVLQLNVPDHLRGRVMGFYGITYSLAPLGGLLAGWIASFSSVPAAIAICATGYLAVTLVIGVTQQEIRRLDASC